MIGGSFQGRHGRFLAGGTIVVGTLLARRHRFLVLKSQPITKPPMAELHFT